MKDKSVKKNTAWRRHSRQEGAGKLGSKSARVQGDGLRNLAKNLDHLFPRQQAEPLDPLFREPDREFATIPVSRRVFVISQSTSYPARPFLVVEGLLLLSFWVHDLLTNEDEENDFESLDNTKDSRAIDKLPNHENERASGIEEKPIDPNDLVQAEIAKFILKCKSTFKCRLCSRILCLNEATVRAHLTSKKFSREIRLVKVGRLDRDLMRSLQHLFDTFTDLRSLELVVDDDPTFFASQKDDVGITMMMARVPPHLHIVCANNLSSSTITSLSDVCYMLLRVISPPMLSGLSLRPFSNSLLLFTLPLR
ncbi:hypothetical protein KSP40_PGU002816 [Platanthera guangdongensis]|uniref:Uncharacterized protein n=1 Tax=Platanthera guangdongensis TaxID=2320717 RepID=A0ABR2LGH1_9ASPA